MLRRGRRSSEKMVPGLLVLLRHPSCYPGDRLQGVAILNLPFPCDILALEVRILGKEKSSLGGLIFTDKNPEARHTTYYEQFITLRGIGHDLLQMKQPLLSRCATVMSREAFARKSISFSTEEQTPQSLIRSAAFPPPSPMCSEVPDLTASVTQSTRKEAVHLIPGTYSYPFSVILPDNLPASRELSHGRDGRCVLRYCVIASLIMTSGKIYTSEARFRVNPLPVQVQRWYQLHGNEQLLFGNAVQHDEADNTKPRSRFMARLMSSVGALPADTAERNREAASMRCMRHHRQFHEDQLALETAEYTETTNERADQKKHLMRGKEAMAGAPLAATAETLAERVKSNPRKLRSQREQEEKELRSLDGEDVTDGVVNQLDSEPDDQVYIFLPESPLEAVATSTAREMDDDNDRVDCNSGGMSVANPASLGDEDGTAKPRRACPEKVVANAPAYTAMVEQNVEKLFSTPPEKELPTPLADMKMQPAHQAEAVSNNNKQKNCEVPNERKSCGTHKDRRFQPPQWKQEFFLNLRSGVLRTGKVRVLLTLRSPLVTVGVEGVGATVLVDNSGGSGDISHIKYSLVTRSYIRTKAEVCNYQMTTVERSSYVDVKRGKVVTLPEVDLPVPKSTPLTMVTEGMGTLTFLDVRLYVGTTLKTFSKSVATEVVLVSGQDILNCSRRLLRWTCFFRRRSGVGASDITVRPPTINLSEKNSRLCVMDAGYSSAPGKQGRPSLQTKDSHTSSVPLSSVSRSMSILQTGHRISKEAPSVDVQHLARALNYEEAVFMPCDDNGDASGFPSHADPMASLNPLFGSAYNVENMPTEGDKYNVLRY
ncbi:hypothetical protein JKF63_00697 [Porcisia hertigi]|uniref:Arrestin-like N-terminal domain-containing protein n=1 Tax=Porcisia hertigi TaxID=2761500 RepID=A0A836HQF5_9TRYP|nr:hypothetical protein JKF63_00697 [Porcisia hertigi]